MCLLASAKTWARRIKRDVVAVDFAARHPDTPPRARLRALELAAYAPTAIDLILDLAPILGS